MTGQDISEASLRGLGQSFFGDIVSNAKRFRLVGPAYSSMPPEQNRYFRLESAPQTAGPFAAMFDYIVREVGIIGSKQVLKSIVGNVWLPYVMEHDPDDMMVLFENAEKGQAFATRRVMPVIREHPTLSARLEQETTDRHDMTRTKIISSSMTLTCAGLNESAVSTFTCRYIWISESWQHGNDGLLFKAIGRSERFWDRRKILIESQAGLADCDLHRWSQTAHRVPLTWECPFCGPMISNPCCRACIRGETGRRPSREHFPG
jgi:phage terminase large subunit GpA-like protein